MKVPFVDLQVAHQEQRDELDAAFDRVVQRGSFVLGPEVEAFESEFSRYCGVRHCVGVGNGLDAISLALRAFGIGQGDEVIVPAHTFIATWLAVTSTGARPVPVEPNPGTFNMDPALVEASISSRTRAIVAVHLYGQPCDMDALAGIARHHGLRLIEDAAQAHGATWRGTRAGALADAAAFSFYPTKNLGALGDGGAITTDDENVAARVRALRNYGTSEKYHHDTIGVNSRLDELQAALLRVKLRRLNAWNEARRERAVAYLAGLSGVPGLELPAVHPLAGPVWHLFVVRSATRDKLAGRLLDAGISTLVHYPVPPHRSGAYIREYAIQQFPRTDAIAAQALSLPMLPQMSLAQVEHVVRHVKAFHLE